MERLFGKKELIKLIIPLMIDQFLQAFVGLADSIMVARVGEAAVSGVSLVDTVMLLIINIFTALATGGAVIAGQYIGRKEPENGCQATAQLINFTAVFSILVMGGVYLGRNLILSGVFGKIEPDVMYNCSIYLLIVTASIPMIALYNAGAAIFRSMGNSQIAMKTSLLMNSINVGGNALLIFGFHCGVEGVAIPTLVSRAVACIVMLVLLNNQKNLLHLPHPYPLKIGGVMLKKILYIGIPNGLENSMFQLGKIVVLSLVAGYGTASLAANAVCNNVATFAILPGMSIGFAMLTVGGSQFLRDPDFNLSLSLRHHDLALILFPAQHPAGRRRCEIHYGPVHLLHVGFPVRIQCSAWKRVPHGRLWRLGGYDHRLAGTGGLLYFPLSGREVGTDDVFVIFLQTNSKS